MKVPIYEALKEIPLFREMLADGDVCIPFLDKAEEITIQRGEYIVRQGDPASFFIVLEGEIQVLKNVDGADMMLTTHQPGAFFGEIPLLQDTTFVASGRAVSTARVLHLDEELFWKMLSHCPSLARNIMQTMAFRVHNLESVGQGRDRLVSLGTLAAGLAHELNNPTAAARRAASELQTRFGSLQKRSCLLHSQPLTREQMEWIAEMQEEARAGIASAPRLDSLELSDREDEVASWLEEQGLDEAWKWADTFVTAGLDVAWLSRFVAPLPVEALPKVLLWLEAALSVSHLAGEIENSTQRISSLVQSVKNYSYMDRAPVQEIDVHEGLDSTLVMLGHKMRDANVEIVKCYANDLPRIMAYGAELNQVWTNLIDNAIDAMDGGGCLRVQTGCEGDRIVVEIRDSGPGVPEDVRARIFEPFFTTKDIGKGTGLGLGTCRRIVVGNHGGDIAVESKPGDTRFQVRLPLQPPALRAIPQSSNDQSTRTPIAA